MKSDDKTKPADTDRHPDDNRRPGTLPREDNYREGPDHGRAAGRDNAQPEGAHADSDEPLNASTRPLHQPSAGPNTGHLDDTPQQAPNPQAAHEAQQAQHRLYRERNRMPEQKIEPLIDDPDYRRAVETQPHGNRPTPGHGSPADPMQQSERQRQDNKGNNPAAADRDTKPAEDAKRMQQTMREDKNKNADKDW